MQKLLTGLQPSGSLHLGNYFGVLKPLLAMQQNYAGYLMVADYHALTTLKDARILRQNILDIARDYMAVGINAKRLVIFQQSRVPQHTELTWIFNTLVMKSFLELAHAYKDKKERGLETNVGLFDYPVLMASDILLYDVDVVPVGQDQKQHIEYAREIAAKFNNQYGDTFKEPKEHILKGASVVSGVDGQKMSKSYKNTIPLFATKDEIAQLVMSIVTDSAGESPKNVYNIHGLFKSSEELAPIYKANKKNYRASKEALIEDIELFMAPMRERRANISDAEVKEVIEKGSADAREAAEQKMKDVREKIGVTLV